MHILLVNQAPIPVTAYGGTERVIWDLGRQLVALGHRVSYLVPAGSHCDFAQVLPINRVLPWAAQIPADVDLVHFQFDPGCALDRPWLMTEHGNGDPPRPLPVNTVFVSCDHARRHGAECHVLNGLDWAGYGPVDLAAPRSRFHFLGKAAWRVKNVQGAIDVARRAGVELDVLGGDRFNFKRGLRITLSWAIHFHGMVGGQRKLDVLQASRGLIFPVRWHEPFGLAVIESLYFGCPVFATPYGALPELVPPEVGVLATDVPTLAAAVNECRFQAADCHHQAVTRFSARRMAQDYVQVYERVLDGESLNPRPPLLTGDPRGLPWGR